VGNVLWIRDYWFRRADREIDLARRCTSDVEAKVHRKLAARFLSTAYSEAGQQLPRNSEKEPTSF
jgi:hypothetical protein